MNSRILLASLIAASILAFGCGGSTSSSSTSGTTGTTGSSTGSTTGSTGGTTTWVSPMVGPAAGGTTVHLQYSTLITAVTFGSTPATSIIQRSSTRYDVGAPAGNGTVNIEVSAGGATSAIGTYEYVTNSTVSTAYLSAIPVGLGTDSSNRVLFCDANQGDVDTLDGNGNISGTLYGNSAMEGAKAASFSSGDATVFADSTNDIEQSNGAGSSPTVLFSGTSSPFSTGVTDINVASTSSTTFNYYIATPSGITTMNDTPLSSSVTSATKVATDSSGNVYTLTGSTPAVVETTSAGSVIRSFGSYAAGGGAQQFQGPGDITVNSSGDIFILDGGNGRIEKFSNAGTALASYPTSVRQSGVAAYGMTVNSAGALFCVNSTAGTIEVIDGA